MMHGGLGCKNRPNPPAGKTRSVRGRQKYLSTVIVEMDDHD